MRGKPSIPIEVEQPNMVPVVSVPQKTTAERMFPALVVVTIIMAFAVGALWSKSSALEKNCQTIAAGSGKTAGTQQPAAQPQVVQINTQQLKDVFSKNVIKFGNANSRLLAIEVADPSCPFCHVAAGLSPNVSSQMDPAGRFKVVSQGGTYTAPVQEIQKLVDQGKASFAWIYSPGHGAGELATTVLYCAQDQGKFWPVHNKLMTDEGYGLMNNKPLKFDPSQVEAATYKKVTDGDIANMVNFVANTGVNAGQLKDCVMSRKYVTHLQDDVVIASSLGVRGTPGFFVNTTNFAGAFGWGDVIPGTTVSMKSLVDAALK